MKNSTYNFKEDTYTISSWSLGRSGKIGGMIYAGGLAACQDIYDKCDDDFVELKGYDLIMAKAN